MAVRRAVVSLGVGLFAVAVALAVWATYTFVALDVRAAMDCLAERRRADGTCCHAGEGVMSDEVHTIA